MQKQYYMPDKEADKLIWINNLNAKLPSYAAKYGITAAETHDIGTIHDDFSYRLNAANKIAAYSKQWTAYKNALRDGVPAGAEVQVPVAPDLGVAPPVAAPGGFTRAEAIVKKIKSNSAYSVADGQDLQIEGTEVIIDFTTLKPEVSIRNGNAGMPEILWNKQGMDGVAIYKDSGNGFVLYDLDNHPHWQDKHPMPAAGQSAVWKYKLIYRHNDEEVGQWSTILSITVAP
jgi:hypothetical protein